jgi:UPF0755 protein
MTSYDQEPESGPAGRAVKLVVLLGVLAVLAVVAVVGGRRLGRLVGDNISGSEGAGTGVTVAPGREVEVVISPGATAEDIASLLAAKGVVRDGLEFELAIRGAGAQERLKAGTYVFTGGMELNDIIADLEAGPPVATFWVTIPEGLRVVEILDVLARSSGVEQIELVAALTGGTVTTGLRELPEQPTLGDWEGLLFPDTYQFEADASASDILRRLAATMEKRVDDVDWTALEEAGFTHYEGIVIASMIESETRLDRDRPLVSSVVQNRLSQGMPLQIDATILYALGTRGVGLTTEDLAVESPYNTYLNQGLPPTPIGTPGRASLEAAAAPASTDFLFYVLTGEDGSHSFTASYDEFLAWKEDARAAGLLP